MLNAEDSIESNANTIAYNNVSGATGSAYGIGIWIYAWVGSAQENTVHHNDVKNISGTYKTGIWMCGSANDNVIHHNSVEGTTVDNPYVDSGTGNKDFKNSWN